MEAALKPAALPADRLVDLNIYALPGMDRDYQQAWRDVQAANPELVWTPQNEGHWIALRGDVIAEVLADHERFSSRIIIIPRSVGEQHGLIPTTIDPPAHRPYRQLINGDFTPAAVRRMAPDIRAVAIDLIEGFVADGHVDFTSRYARIFPIRIFMAMVDLPMADAPHIQHLAECMTRPEADMSFEEAKRAFYDYLTPILEARRVTPGDDLISRMTAGLPMEEALALSTQILIAGVDTVVNFLGFVMLFLARDAEARRRLAAAPETIPSVAHELFRRFGLVTIARTVTRDMEYRGMRLRAGDLIALPTVLHGLDDRINPDPMHVDLGRRSARHSAFGNGPHLCVGQELARAEVSITIDEWLKRIPEFRVADDADTGHAGGIVGSVRRLCLSW